MLYNASDNTTMASRRIEIGLGIDLPLSHDFENHIYILYNLLQFQSLIAFKGDKFALLCKYKYIYTAFVSKFFHSFCTYFIGCKLFYMRY